MSECPNIRAIPAAFRRDSPRLRDARDDGRRTTPRDDGARAMATTTTPRVATTGARAARGRRARTEATRANATATRATGRRANGTAARDARAKSAGKDDGASDQGGSSGVERETRARRTPSARESAMEAAAAREAENAGMKPSSSGETATRTVKDEALEIPFQSTSPRKRVGRTRLLRTPMAGGVVSRDTKDSNLPSMATAARNLMELADYGDLSTTMSDMHHRRAGYPFGSTVDFATDATGHPIFCLAPLAIHTRNIAADGKCSLTVKMSGWGGLANARVTIFGDVQRLPNGEYQTAANEIFKSKYHARKEAIDMEDRWGDYTYYRMNRIVDVYFVGGFGTLNWIKLDEYCSTSPDTIVTAAHGKSVIETLGELNTRFSQRLAAHMGNLLDLVVDDLWIISIDRRGMDVRVRTDGSSLIRRISFDTDVECFDDAKRAVECALTNDDLCRGEF
jgi:putative heme iron utilization protein